MHRSRLHPIRALVYGACLLPTVVWATSDCEDSSTGALQLLERMSRAGTMVNHQGMATLQRDGDMRVLKIRRNTEGDATTETLTLLTGQTAQVVRSAHPESCVHPGHTLLRLQQGQGSVCGVAAYYRLAMESGDRVAGRMTQRIIAQPRDMYRYAHVLEIDEETAQLLKVTTLTADGRPLEQFQYASLALEDTRDTERETGADTADADTSPGVASSHAAAHPGNDVEGADAATSSGTSAAVPQTGSPQEAGMEWKPEWVPDGFLPTRAIENGNRQTYTDGMASFSVFLEPGSISMQPGEGAVREGSTLAYTRGLRLADSMVLVTVIGEVPVNTARIVADSVRLR
ncbi:MucB/RseB C-terminal domain-containing protein [Chromatocurvus halotolerans]|uniref:MucB/RseB-like sigma(E) regulatory protein n=1 Tax=Chromatocurvus halotolerans TaxID=1132028 RepID=A0A4R2KUY6_9GAMM|nr:MucB/RseB C-terminal domain-containing protein [Chromatocurvus halotolerans]TCO77724.1 MucB/RseB-like sigma(E) regulatory protein [Chromatocurvus halotolerans]